MQGSLEQPPIVLRSGPKGATATLVIGLPCLLLGAMLLASPRGLATGLIVFALGLYFVAFGVALLIWPPRMTVGPSGVAVASGWRNRSYAWDKIANFRVVQVRKNSSIGFDRLGVRGPGVMRDLGMALRAAPVSGSYDGLFPGTWTNAPTDAVVELLNEARVKWGGVAAARAPAPRVSHASGQRIDRRLYWLAAAVLMCLSVGLSLLTHGARGVAGGVTVMWIWVYARRLHDIGRSGWWQAPVFALQLAVLLVLAFEAHWGVAPAAIAALMLQFAFTAALGAIPGDPRENRFGPPPGQSEAAAQAEVFR